jgi:dual specificity tyrosine-phosphorylation-regulated kinase 2/3/4
VVKCIDHGDPKTPIVAVKISKNKKFDVDNANVEIRLLKKLMEGEGDGRNRIVEYLDSFKFRQHVVIVFEILHFNLYKYMRCNKHMDQIFTTSHLRQIVTQMVQGLKYLRENQIIHCDLKPENIIFADESYQEVKLIDFGASC